MKTKKISSSKIIGKTVDAFFWLIIILVSLTCLFPFVHVFAVSISDEAYVVANKVVLIPKGFNLTAYQKIFADSSIIRSLLVTILITVLFTVIGLILVVAADRVAKKIGEEGLI